MNRQTRTFLVGDKVYETYYGTRNEAEIIAIEPIGRVVLRDRQGAEWRSNVVWLTHRKR